jgi:hypothetical protein
MTRRYRRLVGKKLYRCPVCVASREAIGIFIPGGMFGGT